MLTDYNEYLCTIYEHTLTVDFILSEVVG